MDETSHVKNIKQRFENFNSVVNELKDTRNISDADSSEVSIKSFKTKSKTDVAAKFIVPDVASSRPNIKRTPAFRRDKVPIRNKEKNYPVIPSIVSRRVHLFNRIDVTSDEKSFQKDGSNQGCNEKTKGLKTSKVHCRELSDTSASIDVATSNLKSKKPPKHVKIFKSKQVSDCIEYLESENTNKKSLINKDVKDMEKIVNKENNYYLSNLKSLNEINELSDSLKRVLRSPLPPGPPPKKPPRTFTSAPCTAVTCGITSGQTSNKTCTKLNDQSKIRGLSTMKQDMDKPLPKIPLMVRSKTESEIKLKKIETALLKHQKPNAMRMSSSSTDIKPEKFASIHKNKRRSSDNGNLFQFSSCISDLNCSTRSKSLQYPSTSFIPFPPKENKKDLHIYEDPKKVIVSKSNSEKGSPDDSLYYMSTPIEEIVNSSNSNQRFITEVKNLHVTMNPKLNDCINGDLNGNSSDIDSKIKLWMNEAYSQSWTKASDASNDSDSSLFSSHEEQSSNECKKEQVSVAEYDQVTLKRKGYVQRIASKVLSRTQSVLAQPVTDYKHLFECLLLIGLNLDTKGQKVPYIKMKYPSYANVPQWIEHMCFPDAHDWSNIQEKSYDDKFSDDRSYVIPLTTEAGLRKYAFCRQIKPEGESYSLPLSYCILSRHKANEFYFKVLEEIENRHGESELEFSSFIRELYHNSFPRNGQGIEISGISQNGQEKVKEKIVRPIDTRQEDLRLAKILEFLKFDTFSLIFSSLLLERKVILLSNNISKLSTCIEGLLVALLPFEWQHTLITVVPSNVISVVDLCDAPTPYLIGLLKPKNHSARVLPQLNIKLQVLVVDLDEKKVLRKIGDEASILPNHLAKGLRNALQLAHSSEIRTNNLLACEAFTRFFVEAVGHYRRYIILSGNDVSQKKLFQKEAFIKAASTHQIRMFLEWFAETAAFNVFINTHIQNVEGPRGLFEQRCKDYCEELSRHKQEKNNKINKTVKQLGDLIKDWTNTS